MTSSGKTRKIARRGPLSRLAGFALGFTFVMWLAFSEILGIVLPYGPLTGLARSWGLLY